MNDMTMPAKQARKPITPQSSRNTPRQLVHSVTADNYPEIGKAFIAVHGGAVIALEDAKTQDVECPACPRQWGAWRAYFKARKIKTGFMDQRGREGKMWTVPAAWPHEFDGDATVQSDMEAATRFMRNYRPERIDMADLAHRQATIAAWRSRMPREGDAAKQGWE